MTGHDKGHDNGPPFQKHRFAYMALKLALLALAVLLAVRLLGVW